MQCPGSRILCAQFPEKEDTPESIEGTLAHDVVASAFCGGDAVVGATEEMLDGAELWIDTTGFLRESCTAGHIHVEERVECSTIHPECWGTPDLWAYNHNTQYLYVYEYKFGHRHVEVFENWQLLTYAIGILSTLGCDVHKIVLTVVQPRSYHVDGPVREWRLDPAQITGYAARLTENCKLAMSDFAQTVTGAECRDCSGRHACTTLQSAAYSVMQQVGKPVPFNLDQSAIGRELTMLKAAQEILNARAKGLEDEVLVRVRQGASVAGWMMQQSMGRQKWSKPIEEVLALGSMMGIDISKPGALTPKQAIKAGLPEELVADYSETPLGEVKLVPDDGRKAIAVFKGA
jgi:hypothetical protein